MRPVLLRELAPTLPLFSREKFPRCEMAEVAEGLFRFGGWDFSFFSFFFFLDVFRLGWRKVFYGYVWDYAGEVSCNREISRLFCR